ncbi:MAG: DNA primase [Rhodobacteraceae bacterium]|nr:DNA primase [Paracoccaceae bacterium]
MRLPPGFLDELNNRLSLSQVAGRKVIWDTRKSNQAKGDMWAPCPFHQEKTASFHVDDRKGVYYCFGCHAKGNAITFVRETENVSFTEAVEILAREAGLQIPERDPGAQERADRRATLAQVTEAALGWFRLQLKTGAGTPAREYLAQRGLDGAALDRFEIGYAPAGRNAAFQALRDKGFDAERIVATDIARQPEDGRAPYDAFRDRIIFPIRDVRGCCTGFGGRAMAAGAQAKYLNSRETALFSKGRALYNHGPAREAAGKGQPLVVAEGYMDVIALVRAGFKATVAPLGTAITRDQLRLLWRMADEPIIALDGDSAGRGAAWRLIDLALPLLEAGKSLRFALMPQGQDPDDLIRAKGSGAMQALLEKAHPIVALLWQRETDGKTFDSPERCAALDKSLGRAIGQIRDTSIRRHYGQAVNDLRWQFFRAQRQARGQRTPPEAAPAPATKLSVLAAGTLSETDLRIALILATLANYPVLIDQFETDLGRLAPANPDHARLAARLLSSQARKAEALQKDIIAANLGQTLENIRSLGHVRIQPFLCAPGDEALAELCLAEEFAKLAAHRGIDHELAEALEDIETTEDDPRLSWRLKQAIQTRHNADHPALPDTTHASEGREALSARLKDLVESRAWEKKKR